jgi:hypothetical protein
MQIKAACCMDFESAILVFSVREEGSSIVVDTKYILEQILRCWKGKICTVVWIFFAWKLR